MLALIRRYLISGLLVWAPIWVTLLLIRFIAELLDSSLLLLPKHLQPDYLVGFHIPGLGLIFTLAILFFTGMIVTNFLGRKLMELWYKIVNKIPLVRSVYMGAKQIMETLFTPQGTAFRKVLLVRYPHPGLWSIAFQTGEGCEEVNDKLKSPMLTIFIPTTPNPTSGFLMMVRREDVYELNMAVEEALKFVISLGVVQPNLEKLSHLITTPTIELEKKP